MSYIWVIIHVAYSVLCDKRGLTQAGLEVFYVSHHRIYESLSCALSVAFWTADKGPHFLGGHACLYPQSFYRSLYCRLFFRF